MSIVDRNRPNLEAARAKYQFKQQSEEEAKALLDKPAVSMGYDPVSGRYQIARSGENATSVSLITNGAIGTGDRVTVKGGKFLDGMPRPPAVEEPIKKEPATKISADMLLSRTEGSDRVFYVQRKANLDRLASIPLKIPPAPPVLPPDGLPNRPGVYGWTVFYIRSNITGFIPGLPTSNGFSATGFSFSAGARSNSNLWYELRLYQTGVRFDYPNNVSGFTINQAYVVSSLDLINGAFTQEQFYESTYFIWRFSALGHKSGQVDFGCDFEVATHFTKNTPPPAVVIGSNFYRAEARLGSAAQPIDPYMPGLSVFPVAYDNSSWQLFKYANISGDGTPDPIPPPPAATPVDNVFDCYISATKPKTSYVLIRDRVTAADTTMRVQYLQVSSKITSLAVPQTKDWRSSRVSPNPSPPSDPDVCKNQYRGGSSTFDPVNDCLSIAKKKLFHITDSKGKVLISSDYSLLTTKPSPAVIELKTLRSLPSSCDIAPKLGKKKRYTLPKLKEAGLEIRGVAPIFT